MTKSERLLEIMLAEFATGLHPAGSHLPTHRAFAKAHNVSLAVVNRVYEGLRRRELISTDRRRGTIAKPITGKRTNRAGVSAEPQPAPFVDLTHNFPILDSISDELRGATLKLLSSTAATQLPREQSLRTAGKAWLERLSLTTNERVILPTIGGQHALLAALIALRRQSTTIFADQYTYSGLRLAARALDLQLVPVQMDSQGMSVKHLKSEIKRVGPGTLYLMPSLHNPMAFEMPRDRKRQLALTAKDSGCSIIEDETYRYLIKNPTASMAEVFPEGTVTITTLSKIYGPQMQLGFIGCPTKLHADVNANLRACVWGNTSPLATVAAEWIMSSRIDHHLSEIHASTKQFRALVETTFSEKILSSSKDAFFIWLKLPPRWTSGGFVEYARRSGVLLLPAEQFSLSPSPTEQFVRFSGLASGATKAIVANAIKSLGLTYNSNPAELIDSA